MSKSAFSLIALILCVGMLFSACGKNADNGGEKFVMPKDIITVDEYHTRVEKLLEYDNFTVADDEYFKTLETLGTDLENMIKYNTDELPCSGTKYYVSNTGDDKNDGKTPETAWATLEKVNSAPLKSGDMILFQRGGLWRGHVLAKNGVTYSAYGEGYKPKIWASVDGIAHGKWVKTETENVWKLDEKIFIEDVNVVVFNGVGKDALFGEKKEKLADVKKDYDFVFQGQYVYSGRVDNCLYLYCSKGNPADVFSSIEISLKEVNITTLKGVKDVTIHNLDLTFGYKPFDFSWCDNMHVSYCISGWQGGAFQSKGGVRAGGGGYVMPAGNNVTIENCYFYQQFDSGVTPQVAWNTSDGPAMFENFVTKNCLFDYCDYTFEYFNTQADNTQNAFKGMYFGYNLCRTGGYGFGTKPSASAYVKSWGHENTCYDSVIEYNIFDRAVSWTLEIMSYKQNADGTKTISYELMPTLRNNIYIQQQNKRFANLAEKEYRYNESDIADIQALGIDKGSVYMVALKSEK